MAIGDATAMPSGARHGACSQPGNMPASPTSPPASPLQRLGELLALVEFALFGLAAYLHAGGSVTLLHTTLDEPVLVPAALIEGAIAIGLLVSVLMPGRGVVRVRRVVFAQLIAVVGVLGGQVALAYGLASRTRSNDLMQVVMLAMSIVSLLMLAWPHVPLRSTTTSSSSSVPR
jgi:hypothetical protein